MNHGQKFEAPRVGMLMSRWGHNHWNQEFYKKASSEALPGLMDLSLKPECEECINVSGHKLMEGLPGSVAQGLPSRSCRKKTGKELYGQARSPLLRFMEMRNEYHARM
ncbi:unnamed protein product [Symbiodinium sp. CCMP2592]|nr:unnamed protein product [Symbiodinium sp. CCMP2592]